jgi:cell wall-associated NlpC family hydrolase
VLDAATDAEHEVAGRYAVVMEQFNRYRAALDTLNTRNANQLEAARAARDAYESSLAASRGASTNTAGMQASPDALAAVAFALSQLGKPYAWAEEGPNSYDCSGLVYASYLSVGVKLPRVANNQYGAGQPVLASQLLPGDLIFFSTNPSDWRQIHHVAMYIGNGKVVQAPTFGDVVKISPVWWTEYFGATRIIPAIAAPVAAEPTPEPSASPTGTPSPSATGTPSPEPTGTPTPAPAPTTTAPAATTPPVTPTGTPSPAPNPSPTASVSSTPAATTSSPSASATTPAPTTTTPDTSPDPAVSPTSTPSEQGRRRRR